MTFPDWLRAVGLFSKGDESSARTRANPRNLMGFLDAFKAIGGVPGWLYEGRLEGGFSVMAGLVPAIHVLLARLQQVRGCPGIGEPKRRRPSDGYARA